MRGGVLALVMAGFIAASSLAAAQTTAPPGPILLNIHCWIGANPFGTACDGAGPGDTNGFPTPAAQTSEEKYFRIASIPFGYAVSKITLHNTANPNDISRVENTPQYWLFLYHHDQLLFRVWLRPRRWLQPDLVLNLVISLVRSDDPHAFPGQRDPIYARELNQNPACDHLHISYNQKVMDVPPVSRESAGFASAIFERCSQPQRERSPRPSDDNLPR